MIVGGAAVLAGCSGPGGPLPSHSREVNASPSRVMSALRMDIAGDGLAYARTGEHGPVYERTYPASAIAEKTPEAAKDLGDTTATAVFPAPDRMQMRISYAKARMVGVLNFHVTPRGDGSTLTFTPAVEPGTSEVDRIAERSFRATMRARGGDMLAKVARAAEL